MPLFQQSVQKKFIKDLDKAKVEAAYQKLIAHFGNIDVQENIKKAKEEQYQEGFLRELFVDVLGYVLNPQPNYNLITEQKNEKDSKKADGAILKNTSNGFKPIGIIELKSVKTTDLQAIEIQAFNYKNNQTECVYVVTSNFQKIRFYIDNAVDFEEFDLFDLSKERFDLLYLCLQVDNILSDLPLRIKQASFEREESITKKLYADYSLFKQTLFKDITDNNKSKGFKPLELFKKTQKLLDRFLFIFFAEDKGLLPPNSVSEILNQWDKLKELDAYQPLYNRFKLYFGYLNNGHKGKHYAIFAYNGGLFAPDDLLDNLKITDNVLYNHCQVLSHYDFDTEVDTNILGHIFEHSLNEIDEVAADSNGSKPIGIGKRKKDGIFYTPRYITKYIVHSTIGELCKQKKLTLGLDNEALVKADTKKDRKLYQVKIDEYRKWLLQLTILDPACGSGAFLNQAFEFLLQEHRLIDSMTAMLFGDSLVMTDNVTEILENNIYGVDINEESVEIARLSLWLRTAKVGRKLNDLSHNIKCGNSLISDPLVAGDLAFDWHKAFPQIFHRKDKEGFHVVLTTHNSRTSKRMIAYKVKKGEPLEFNLEDEIAMTKIMRDIILEKGYNCIAYNICKDHVHLILVCEYSDLANIVKTIKGKSAYLFNRRDGGNNGLKPIEDKSDGFQPIEYQSNELKPIGDAASQSNGFQPESVWSQKFFRAFLDSWELAELSKKPGWIYNDTYLDNAINYVQNNRNKHGLPQSDELDALIASFCKNTEEAYAPEITGGFDVIIGNPPYVNAKGQNFTDAHKEYFYKNYQTAIYQIDTYILFFERLKMLLNKESLGCYIVPNAWLNNLLLANIRKYILDNFQLKSIVNTPIGVFADATVDTIIFNVCNNNSRNEFVEIYQAENQDIKHLQSVKQERFLNNDNYTIDLLTNDVTKIFIVKMEENTVSLESITDMSGGIKEYQAGKGKPKQTDSERLENKFNASFKENDTFLPHILGANIQNYILNWEGNYLSYGEWLAEPRKKKYFEGERLIIREIPSKAGLVVAYTNEIFTIKNSAHIVLPQDKTYPIKALLALLNSKLMGYYFKFKFSEFDTVFPKAKIGQCKLLPIKKLNDNNKEQYQHLAELTDNLIEFLNSHKKQTNRFIKLITSMGNPRGLNPLKNPLKMTINKKIEKWYEMSFGEFRKELAKQKIAIPIRELMDYQELFDTNASQIKELQAKIINTEKAIDKLVYALYDLTSEEIQVIENQ